MRRDMKHIIIDTGRSNSRYENERGFKRRGGRGRVSPHVVRDEDGECIDWDDSPRRGKMSMGRGSKELSDRLTPFERWLRKQVGRPWDKVYSEIAEVSRGADIRSHHLRQHVDDLVVRMARFEGGKLYSDNPDDFNGVHGVYVSSKGKLYVCPRTGILKLWESCSQI